MAPVRPLAAPTNDQPELVSGAEAGRRLGMSRERVSQLARDPGARFPEPRGRVGPSVVWEWAAVARWAEDRGRSPAAPDTGGSERPADSGTFVGRADLLGELVEDLRSSRLVTLTGSAGVGKTRLAERLLRAAGSGFSGGARVVELASTRDPALVPQVVAAALGVRDHAGGSRTLIAHLAGLRFLLVLDNCEHLLGGAAALARDLLGACPRLSIVATSQEPLGLEGELVRPVPPLSVPDAAAGLEAIGASEAVRLFCQRAASVREGFDLTPQAAPAVAEICRRLDGVPLAIELAAARLAVLTPAEVAALLDDRFGLLSSPSGDGHQRHQALRSALDWSFNLLPPPERALLSRMSVFAGGCSFEAVRTVCGPELPGGGSVIDPLSSLVARSLVVADTSGDRARYTMLESIRLYAAERLAESGEEAALRGRHLAWCVSVATRAERELTGPGQLSCLDLLDVEHDNLRAALGIAIRTQDAPSAVRLAGSLTLFWRVRGHFREGRRWLESSLALTGEVDAGPLAQALWGLGFLALMLDDPDAAGPVLDRSLELRRRLGDRSGEARSLLLMGNARFLDDPAGAPALLEDSIRIARDSEDGWCLCHSLALLAVAHLGRGDTVAARPLLEESLRAARAAADPQSLRIGLHAMGSLALSIGDHTAAEPLLLEGLEFSRQLGEPFDIAAALEALGQLATRRGDLARAGELLGEALVFARRTGNPVVVANPLCGLGTVALGQGRTEDARTLFAEANSASEAPGTSHGLALEGLAEIARAEGDPARARQLLQEPLAVAEARGDPRAVARALYQLGLISREERDLRGALESQHRALRLRVGAGDVPGIADSLEALGGLAIEVGRWGHAARLEGAAAALRASSGCARPAHHQTAHDADVARLRSALGPATFDAAWSQGAAMSQAQAAAYAVRGRGARDRPREGWHSLTPAERNVVDLIVEGLTNGGIAERLFISRSTVEGHISRIFGKLGLDSRTQLVRERVRRAAGDESE